MYNRFFFVKENYGLYVPDKNRAIVNFHRLTKAFSSKLEFVKSSNKHVSLKVEKKLKMSA